jgi:predicted kinase
MKKDKINPVLTIMCGFPKSGKSTWIEKNKNFLEDIIVSPDEIRRIIFGHQYHQNAEPFIWAFAEGMTRMLLEQGRNVIVDATNTTYSGRVRWIIIARNYDVKLRIIWIKTSLEECLKRNKKSLKDKLIPEDVMRQMEVRFEEPYAQKTSDDKNYCIELIEVNKF